MTLDRVIVRGNQRTEGEVIQRTWGSSPAIRSARRGGWRSSATSTASASSPASRWSCRAPAGRPRRATSSCGWRRGCRGASATVWAWSTARGTRRSSAPRRLQLRPQQRGREGLQPADRPAGSTRDQSFRVLFDQPYVGRYPVPVTYSVFLFNEDKENWDVIRWGGRRGGEERTPTGGWRWRTTTGSWRRRCRTIWLSNVDREDRPYRLSSLIPSFLWDGRNDPVLATRGWSTLAQLQWASPILSTDGDFLKLFVQQTQYVGLGHFGVLAASLRAGGIEPFSRLPGNDPDCRTCCRTRTCSSTSASSPADPRRTAPTAATIWGSWIDPDPPAANG